VAYLSYQLATIKTDVELELGCEELKCSSLRLTICWPV
jgi:DNA polymerase-1